MRQLTLVSCRGGGMVDAPALGAGGSNPVEVQVLSPAPIIFKRTGVVICWVGVPTSYLPVLLV